MRTILTAGLALMKTAGGSSGALRKALEAKSGSDAAAAAKKLEGVFIQVEAFWTSRQADDAVKYSRDARTAANDIACAAESGGDPSAALAGLGAACKSCRETQREKASDGSWRIK